MEIRRLNDAGNLSGNYAPPFGLLSAGFIEPMLLSAEALENEFHRVTERMDELTKRVAALEKNDAARPKKRNPTSRKKR